MRYIIDNDLHIHSVISDCSSDPEQSTERILQYAIENKLKTICLTDHFWDATVEGASDWYAIQPYERIQKALPLPQTDGIRFLFGCETELNKDYTLGISLENFDLFDFVVIPTTHFHMTGYTLTDEQATDANSKSQAWCDRFDAVLNMPLPFHKVGIAHLTCGLIAPTRAEFLEVVKAIPDSEMIRLFTKAAALRVGIELNSDDMKFADSEADIVLRPYKIAKNCGCKFYLGSDAHHPKGLDEARNVFERAIDFLSLQEEDKFLLNI